MKLTLAEKVIKNHLISGEMIPGREIGIRIDQTLTQDSTGTMAYLQFEAMGIDRVKTKLSVAYIDHNMLQSGPENADDHLYIKTVAKKHGIYFSKYITGLSSLSAAFNKPLASSGFEGETTFSPGIFINHASIL
jgi:aconitate hydratase